jgi:DNA polymerase-3 subunit delta
MARPERGGSTTPHVQELITSVRGGKVGPVYLLCGPERFLIERAAELLKRASLGDGPPGFNDDLFHGNSNFSAQKLINAARTLPMMARARYVLARDVDEAPAEEQEKLAAYIAAAVDTTCVVLTAPKLEKRTKLFKAAQSACVAYDAQPLKGPALRRFASDEAARRGNALDGRAAEALIEALGDDLAAIDDACERLSLYVGDGKKIEAEDVEACVSRIAADSIWKLVDAVGMRDLKSALHATGSLLADREAPLRILGMVARQLRIVAKMREALASGLEDKEAAMQAGAPPFKARELKESARRFTQRDLAAAFATLAETDVALKGSRVPPEQVLEEAIVALCTGRVRVRERIPRHQRTYR